MVRNDRHASKEVREALAVVEREGWTLVRRSGHAWALIRCPRGCCQLSVFATPQNPGNHARRIAQAPSKCPSLLEEDV